MNVQTENRFTNKNFQGVQIEQQEKVSFGTAKNPSFFAMMQIERLNARARSMN